MSRNKKKPFWNPPYPSTKVRQIVHWLGKPVELPPSVSPSELDTLAKSLEVLLPIYDVAIRRHPDGDLFLYVDDLGGGFLVR